MTFASYVLISTVTYFLRAHGRKITFANKIEAVYVRSHENVKVKPRSTSHLISTLYILPLFCLRD